MTEWTYPTAFHSWDHQEDDAMTAVHLSHRYTMGEQVKAFEEEFAAFHGMKHAVMVNSGSSANLLMIEALLHKSENPLRRGDAVVVPALAWATTYAPLVQHGLQLVLADCDDTWNAPAGTVEARIIHADRRHRGNAETDGAVRLVLGCSVLGNPADLSRMRQIADDHMAYFIEDNCESLGAGFYTGGGNIERRTGMNGLMNSFSLFWSHQLSAIEGGVITTDSDEMDRLLRMLRAHGWTRDLEQPRSFDDEYRFELMGYNLRPLELHAAIARRQLRKLEGFRRFREGNLNNFITWTSGLPIAHQRRNGIPSPFGLAFCVHNRGARRVLVEALRKDGIDCRLPTGGSFTRHPYGAPWRDQKTPNADLIHDTGLFLGNAPFDISDKIVRAVEIMREVL